MSYKNIISAFCHLINIDEKSILSCDRIGGMTNTNYLITTKNERFVFRVSGKTSNQIINRRNEYNNSMLMSELGINPEIIYFNEHNGDKVTKYINNAMTLSPYNIFGYLDKIVDLLVDTHSSGAKFINKWEYLEEYKLYKRIILDSDVVIDDKYYHFESKILGLYRRLFADLGINLFPCHNDLVAENFVLGDDILISQKLYLIDWEYSGLNDPMWDIASLFEESNFPKHIERKFLENYCNLWNIKKNNFSYDLSTPPPSLSKIDILEEKILIYKILQNALWYLWTLAKESRGDFFGNYKCKRLERIFSLYSEYKENYI
ncbi:choline kinase family protein [Gallibacterium anatis]|uniref:choline kinase family protein n=1 Tax=Gallibacterium anatis TaxID=750 RepID=UPI003005CDCD